MPDQPDLAALREKAEAYYFLPRPDVLAVLALVDRLQGENERLREAIEEALRWIPSRWFVSRLLLDDALSVPPAEKTHPPAAARKEPR